MNNFYTIKETIDNYVKGCHSKVNASASVLLGKAFLAGMMIAFGAAGSNVAAHSIGNVGCARVMAGVIFPMGLMMVVLMGAELFTGDCMVSIGNVAKEYSILKTLRVFGLVYIGNFVGGGLLALAINLCGQLDYSGGLLGAYTIKVALGKVQLSAVQCIVSGILCNILVCGAVVMAGCAKDVSGKLLSSFFVILLFVTSGFEHCVANMYYITSGLIAKENSDYVRVAMEKYNLTAEQLSNLDIPHFLVNNLLPVTIGNIIGGAGLGITLYLLNCRKSKKEA